MVGTKTAEIDEKPFVAINTSIPVDAQVFAAAHELYHIWYDKKAEALLPSILDEHVDHDISELRANRFATEFLMEQDLLHSEMNLYSIIRGRITIKDILTLASLFTVPYKAMVKRLHEVSAIVKEDRSNYLSKSDSTIEQLRKRFSIPKPETDCRIALDNLVDLAVSSYENKLISFEKLEYLLSMSNLEPADIGISKPDAYIPPSDDELDEIMGE